MALVNSDLFLLQDAVSKTNYKVSFQNIKNQIEIDVDLDAVVAVAGDNMTGNLTLGTNKIVLNVDGGATFGEDRVTVLPSGVLETWRKTSNGPDKLHSWHSNVGGSRVERIRFNANGSINAAGLVVAQGVDVTQPASGYTYIGRKADGTATFYVEDVGSAAFAGGEASITNEGVYKTNAFYEANRTANNEGLWYGKLNGTTTSTILADGSITVAGKIENIVDDASSQASVIYHRGLVDGTVYGTMVYKTAGNLELRAGANDTKINLDGTAGSIIAAGPGTFDGYVLSNRYFISSGLSVNYDGTDYGYVLYEQNKLYAGIALDGSITSAGSITAAGKITANSFDLEALPTLP